MQVMSDGVIRFLGTLVTAINIGLLASLFDFPVENLLVKWVYAYSGTAAHLTHTHLPDNPIR